MDDQIKKEVGSPGVFFEEDNPGIRKPEHRYEKAKKLVANEMYFCPYDEYIDKTIRYLKVRESDTEGKEMFIRECYPYLHYSTKLFSGDFTGNKFTGNKLMIHCGILGRASCAELANECGLGEEYIDTYEKVFFDIRDRLDNTNYITNHVFKRVSPQLSSEVGEVKPQDIYMLIAYFGGWKAYKGFNGAEAGIPDGVGAILKQIGQKSELFKAVMASLMEKVGDGNAHYVLGRFVQQGDSMVESKDEQGELNDLVDNIKQLSDGMDIRTATSGELSEKEEHIEVV